MGLSIFFCVLFTSTLLIHFATGTRISKRPFLNISQGGEQGDQIGGRVLINPVEKRGRLTENEASDGAPLQRQGEPFLGKDYNADGVEPLKYPVFSSLKTSKESVDMVEHDQRRCNEPLSLSNDFDSSTNSIASNGMAGRSPPFLLNSQYNLDRSLSTADTLRHNRTTRLRKSQTGSDIHHCNHAPKEWEFPKDGKELRDTTGCIEQEDIHLVAQGLTPASETSPDLGLCTESIWSPFLANGVQDLYPIAHELKRHEKNRYTGWNNYSNEGAGSFVEDMINQGQWRIIPGSSKLVDTSYMNKFSEFEIGGFPEIGRNYPWLGEHSSRAHIQKSSPFPIDCSQGIGFSENNPYNDPSNEEKGLVSPCESKIPCQEINPDFGKNNIGLKKEIFSKSTLDTFPSILQSQTSISNSALYMPNGIKDFKLLYGDTLAKEENNMSSIFQEESLTNYLGLHKLMSNAPQTKGYATPLCELNENFEYPNIVSNESIEKYSNISNIEPSPSGLEIVSPNEGLQITLKNTKNDHIISWKDLQLNDDLNLFGPCGDHFSTSSETAAGEPLGSKFPLQRIPTQAAQHGSYLSARSSDRNFNSKDKQKLVSNNLEKEKAFEESRKLVESEIDADNLPAIVSGITCGLSQLLHRRIVILFKMKMKSKTLVQSYNSSEKEFLSTLVIKYLSPKYFYPFTLALLTREIDYQYWENIIEIFSNTLSEVITKSKSRNFGLFPRLIIKEIYSCIMWISEVSYNVGYQQFLDFFSQKDRKINLELRNVYKPHESGNKITLQLFDFITGTFKSAKKHQKFHFRRHSIENLVIQWEHDHNLGYFNNGMKGPLGELLKINSDNIWRDWVNFGNKVKEDQDTFQISGKIEMNIREVKLWIYLWGETFHSNSNKQKMDSDDSQLKLLTEISEEYRRDPGLLAWSKMHIKGEKVDSYSSPTSEYPVNLPEYNADSCIQTPKIEKVKFYPNKLGELFSSTGTTKFETIYARIIWSKLKILASENLNH